MPEILKVGDIVLKRNEPKKEYIKDVKLNNGTALNIAVLLSNGVEKGKTILLTSTEHGVEIQCIARAKMNLIPPS